jgi:membrane-associated phospholipid phosphatase
MRQLFSSIPRVSARSQSIALAMATLLLILAWALWRSDWNREAMLAVHSADLGPAWLWIFLTQGGDAAVVLLLLLAAGRSTRQGAALAVKGFLIGSVVSPALKMWLSVPRPLAVLDITLLSPMGNPPASANAMPSGHALAASTLVCLIVLMYPSLLRRKALLIPLILGGLVVAFSRVVVGAHWPADVIAGLGLGIWIAWLAQRWEWWWSWTPYLSARSGSWLLLILEAGLAIYVVLTAPPDFAAKAAMGLVALIGLLSAVSRYLGLQHQRSQG